MTAETALPSVARSRRHSSILIPVAAVTAAALVGICLVALMACRSQRRSSIRGRCLGSSYSIAVSINRSVVFALVGIGFVLANRANLTNVGGEGQIAVGGIAATAVALYGGVAHLPLGLPILVPMLAATAAGAFWGAIAGVLKVKAGTNEVIRHAAAVVHCDLDGLLVVQSEALLRRPMTTSATLPESLEIPESTQLPLLTGDYSFPLHIGMPIAIVIAIIVAIALEKTIRPENVLARAVGSIQVRPRGRPAPPAAQRCDAGAPWGHRRAPDDQATDERPQDASVQDGLLQRDRNDDRDHDRDGHSDMEGKRVVAGEQRQLGRFGISRDSGNVADVVMGRRNNASDCTDQ